MQRAFGLEFPESLSEMCDPAKMALVVYDMQIGILSQLSSGAAVLEKVLEVLAVARAHDMRIIFMRHLSMPTKLAGVFQLSQAMRWQRVNSPEEVQPWFLRDSPGFQLAPELEPRADEAILDKITMSAFESTPLNIILRDCGINRFALCGVATEIGIKPTMRHAADLGYLGLVLQDACGAGDSEAGQRAINVLKFHGDAVLTDVASFHQALRASAAPSD